MLNVIRGKLQWPRLAEWCKPLLVLPQEPRPKRRYIRSAPCRTVKGVLGA